MLWSSVHKIKFTCVNYNAQGSCIVVIKVHLRRQCSTQVDTFYYFFLFLSILYYYIATTATTWNNWAMPKDLERWEQLGGHVYDQESLKDAHVVPAIAALPFERKDPVAIDVGSGSWSVASSVRLEFPRRMQVASVDCAVYDWDSDTRPKIRADIDAIVGAEDAEAQERLVRFLSATTGVDEAIGADLVLYSEILNYVDYRETVRWFSGLLRPGGFSTIVNMPTRGFRNLAVEGGVTSNQELIDFMTDELGHTIHDLKYPDLRADDLPTDTCLLILTTRTPR